MIATKISMRVRQSLVVWSCEHKIVKGFKAIQKGESPLMFADALLRRLPKSVKAKR